jgi:hypothetical protein
MLTSTQGCDWQRWPNHQVVKEKTEQPQVESAHEEQASKLRVYLAHDDVFTSGCHLAKCEKCLKGGIRNKVSRVK